IYTLSLHDALPISPLLRRILRSGPDLAIDAVPRRCGIAARIAVAYRVRFPADGQHARSIARHAGVPQVRGRRIPRVAFARAARVPDFQLPPPGGLVLHAAVRGAGPVRPVDGV